MLLSLDCLYLLVRLVDFTDKWCLFRLFFYTTLTISISFYDSALIFNVEAIKNLCGCVILESGSH